MPKIHFLPGDNKKSPYAELSSISSATGIFNWMKEASLHNFSKVKIESLREKDKTSQKMMDWGQRHSDNMDFLTIVKKEGVMKIPPPKKDEL